MPEYLAPGVYVEETSFRAKSIQGVGTSTTGFVGPTRKGPPSSEPNGFVPEVLTSFADFERVYGGLDDLVLGDGQTRAINYLAYAVRGFFNEGGARLYVGRAFEPRGASAGRAEATLVAGTDEQPHARFRARFAGAALNGRIRASELLQPATARLMETAPVGTLVRNLGLPPQPARLDASAPPRPLEDGAVLRLAVDGAAPVELTLRGQPARMRGTVDLADPVDIPAAAELRVTIAGRTQTLALAAGQIARADLVTRLNDDLGGASARLEGDLLVIESDRRGTSADILVEVTPADFLGGPFEALPAGPASVADMDALTPADLDAVLAAAGQGQVRASFVPGTSFLRLTGTTTGAAASLALADTPARAVLGFGAAPASGQAGVERRYFVREADQDGAPRWREHARVGASFEPGAATAGPAVAATTHALVELAIEISDADGNSLSYEGLGLDPAHPRHLGRVLDPAATRRAEILDHPVAFHQRQVSAANLHAALFAAPDADPETGALAQTHAITGGDDGALPSLQAHEQALARLGQIEDVAIVAAPGSSAHEAIADAVQRALIGHAERSRFRIAVLDPPRGQTPGEVRITRGQIDSHYAALYWPWIVIANPRSRPGREDIAREVVLPPSGHMAGIFARNDSLRGVWKAPANEVVREALRFERDVAHGEQEVLNPLGINCLRFFMGRGYRVWGARLATSDREVVYVSDRRYLNYLKRSIDVSTQWAVFEPNGPRLWSNITDAVSSFLFAEWRGGALLGATAELAYFVRCDRSTMSQADLDNGRLICEIGVAIIKPAEFVIFRIGQKTADSRG
jgi:uncharacterized protein